MLVGRERNVASRLRNERGRGWIMPSIDDGEQHETQEFFANLEIGNTSVNFTVDEWMEAVGTKLEEDADLIPQVLERLDKPQDR